MGDGASGMKKTHRACNNCPFRDRRQAGTKAANEAWPGRLFRPLGKGLDMLSTILLIVLVLLLIGALPTWGYSTGWGYGPSGALGIAVVVLLVLLLLGRI
jgi:hypothetical protein